MTNSPIILVPGFWLGAWAWDEVASLLRADGHEVTALTLPGLEPDNTARDTVTLEDHIGAICAAVEASDEPVVLAVHSGAGAPGYAASDRLPERIKTMVYVDSGPAKGALDPNFSAADFPLPTWEDLDENLDGISEEQLETWRARAVPEPGGAIRGSVELTNDKRLEVPTTVLCTSFPSEVIKGAVQEGQAWVGGLTELRNVTWVDIPTSHWPMWSKPKELAALLADAAKA